MRLNNSSIFFFFLIFFASFLGSSSGAVRTVFLSIAHRTIVHSSIRKRGTRSSKSNISGKLPSNSQITMPVAGDAAGTVSRKNLEEDERRAVIDELLEGSNNGKLAHGDIRRVAQPFGCSTKQVSAVWRQYNQVLQMIVLLLHGRCKTAVRGVVAGFGA